MKRLLLLVLFALPIAMMAQSSDSQARIAHQQAEALFFAKNPTLQKIDVAKLAETQKDEHKACKTCGFEKDKKDLPPVAEIPMTEERLAALKANQEKLMETTKALHESGTANENLLKKYMNAIKGNQQQILAAENQLAAPRKEAILKQKSSK